MKDRIDDTLARALHQIVEQYDIVEKVKCDIVTEKVALDQLVREILENEREGIEEEMVVTSNTGQSWLITMDLEDFQLVSIHPVCVHAELEDLQSLVVL